MKIRHLLIGMLAVAGTVACKQDDPVVEPKLEVSTETVSVEAVAGEASFNVTSNQSWATYVDADWVSLEPASGQASEKAVTVKVTAEDNETTEAREATVTVKAGALSKTVKVTQAASQGGETPGVELQPSEWALVGSFNGWDPTSEAYLSVLDENYFVYYAFVVEESTEFKFLKGGAWPPAGQEIGGNGLVEPNTIQQAGGSNIKVTAAGTYDIYLTADLTKFYIMSEGKLPAEATEPAPVENSWGLMGCFVDNQWATDVPMTKEGEWIVAKGAQFTELTFKIRGNQSWADATNIGVAPGSEKSYVNAKIDVVTAQFAKAELGGDAADIKLEGEAGTYDVYFSFENLEVYVMEAGYKPGEKAPLMPAEVAELTTFLSFTSNVASGVNSVTVQLAPEGSVYMETVSNEYGTWDQMTGEGKYLKFDAYSADGTLAAGTYTASAQGGVINEGEFSIGYDTTVDWGWGPMEMTNWGSCWMTHNADGSETGVKITDGTITVAVDGDVYTITVQSSVLEATYVGKLSKGTTGGEEVEAYYTIASERVIKPSHLEDGKTYVLFNQYYSDKCWTVVDGKLTMTAVEGDTYPAACVFKYMYDDTLMDQSIDDYWSWGGCYWESVATGNYIGVESELVAGEEHLGVEVNATSDRGNALYFMYANDWGGYGGSELDAMDVYVYPSYKGSTLTMIYHNDVFNFGPNGLYNDDPAGSKQMKRKWVIYEATLVE